MARFALGEGADYLGFVFYPPSHRYVTPDLAAEIIDELRARHSNQWQAVGVVVNVPLGSMNEIVARCNLDLVQVCGDEDRAYCEQLDRPVIKALRISADARLTPRMSIPRDMGPRGCSWILTSRVCMAGRARCLIGMHWHRSWARQFSREGSIRRTSLKLWRRADPGESM